MRLETDSCVWCPVAWQEATGTSWNIAETYEILLKKKTHFYCAMVKHWHRLHRKVVKLLSLDTTNLIWILPCTTCCEWPCSEEGWGWTISPQALAHFCHAVVLCPDRIRGFMNFRETSKSYFIFMNKLKYQNVIKNYEKFSNKHRFSISGPSKKSLLNQWTDFFNGILWRLGSDWFKLDHAGFLHHQLNDYESSRCFYYILKHTDIEGK